MERRDLGLLPPYAAAFAHEFAPVPTKISAKERQQNQLVVLG